MRTAYKYNETLTLAAKHIFGALVDKAYVTTYDINNTAGEVQARLDNAGSDHTATDKLDLNGDIILLHLTNGNLVEVACSEWCDIELVKSTDMYEVK